MDHLPTVSAPCPPLRPSPFVRALLVSDALAAGGGALAVCLGRIWTVPVTLCDSSTGRRGADVLWAAALGGLLLAALSAVVSLVTAIVGVLRDDQRGSWAAGALLGALVAGAISVGGVAVVLGDSPIFCF